MIPDYGSTALPTDPLVESWQMPDLHLDPVETDMEGGNKRLRSKPGDGIQRVSFSILLTPAQAETLKTFVITTLGRGASRFTMSIWTGNAMEAKTVQFARKLALSNMAPKMRADFDLWVLS